MQSTTFLFAINTISINQSSKFIQRPFQKGKSLRGVLQYMAKFKMHDKINVLSTLPSEFTAHNVTKILSQNVLGQ